MCNKHSFVMDRTGKIYNGGGFVESHSVICNMWSLQQDQVNCYEWKPPEPWPNEEWTRGLVKDYLTFDEKASHVLALERYIHETFPTKEAWESYKDYALHGHRFQDNGKTVVIACRPQLVEVGKDEACWAWGSATVRAWGSATVRAWDSASVRAWGSANVEASDSVSVEAWDLANVRASGSANVSAWGSATVRALGSASVRASDSASVRAWESATIRASGSATIETWGGATVALADLAVLVDRTQDGKVIVRQARKTVTA